LCRVAVRNADVQYVHRHSLALGISVIQTLDCAQGFPVVRKERYLGARVVYINNFDKIYCSRLYYSCHKLSTQSEGYLRFHATNRFDRLLFLHSDVNYSLDSPYQQMMLSVQTVLVFSFIFFLALTHFYTGSYQYA